MQLVVISVSAASPRLRGALTKWMTEPVAGLYVGTLTARVRDGLWGEVVKEIGDGSACLVHPSGDEQHFAVTTAGASRRRVVDLDGLSLIALAPLEQMVDGAQPASDLQSGMEQVSDSDALEPAFF